MKYLYKVLFWVVCSCGLLQSCSVQKIVLDNSEKIINKSDLIKNLNSIELESQQIVIKGSKISIDDNSGFTNLRANFIIIKDSAILVSISNSLGIEVTRAIILPDSIKVLDRINKTYLEERYPELEKRFSIALDFFQIQSILLGDYMSVIKNIVNPGNELKSEQGKFKIIDNYKIDVNDRIETVLIIDQNQFFVNRATILFEKKKQEYDIVYSDYFKIEKSLFPGLLEIEYKKNRENIKLAIQNKNIRLEPTRKMMIDVPASYELK